MSGTGREILPSSRRSQLLLVAITRPASLARLARAPRRNDNARHELDDLSPAVKTQERSRAGTACASADSAAQLPSGGAGLAPRQRDRVVRHGPQARDDPQAARRAARGRGRRDVAARTRDPTRARGGERRVRRRRGARGRRHAERSGRPGCCVPEPRSRRSPGGRPTSTRGRSASRPMRSTLPTSYCGRSRAARPNASASAVRIAGRSSSTPASVSTPP